METVTITTKKYLFTNDIDRINFTSQLRNIGYILHHKAMSAGYVGRSGGGYALDYSGRFGEGIAIHKPCKKGTKYHEILYLIIPEDEGEK